MAVGLQENAPAKLTAISFGGALYLQVAASASATNNTSSEDGDHAVNAGINVAVGSFGAFGGQVWGDFDGGVGSVVDLSNNNQFAPTGDISKLLLTLFEWDHIGQSGNVSITPPIFSRTGGSVQVIIPMAMLKDTPPFTIGASCFADSKDISEGGSPVQLRSFSSVSASIVSFGNTYKAGVPVLNHLAVKKQVSGQFISAAGAGSDFDALWQVDPQKLTVKSF